MREPLQRIYSWTDNQKHWICFWLRKAPSLSHSAKIAWSLLFVLHFQSETYETKLAQKPLQLPFLTGPLVHLTNEGNKRRDNICGLCKCKGFLTLWSWLETARAKTGTQTEHLTRRKIRPNKDNRKNSTECAFRSTWPLWHHSAEYFLRGRNFRNTKGVDGLWWTAWWVTFDILVIRQPNSEAETSYEWFYRICCQVITGKTLLWIMEAG